MPAPRGNRARCHGTTLIETVVALALVATPLLLGMDCYGESERAIARFAARAAALQDLERTVEQLRAGELPLIVGERSFPGRASRLTLEIAPTGVPALYHVSARATYTVRGAAFERTLETAVFYP